MLSKTILYFLLIIMSVKVSGQSISLVNLTVSEKESKVIYIGLDNDFKINNFEYLKKIEHNNLDIIIHEDTITFRPRVTGFTRVSFITTKGERKDITFEVKIIPDVAVIIGGYKDRIIDKANFCEQERISLKTFNDDEAFFINYKVHSFKAYLNNQFFNVEGSDLSKELLIAVQQAQSGDRLVLSSIKATNATTERNVYINSQFVYTLK